MPDGVITMAVEISYDLQEIMGTNIIDFAFELTLHDTPTNINRFEFIKRNEYGYDWVVSAFKGNKPVVGATIVGTLSECVWYALYKASNLRKGGQLDDAVQIIIRDIKKKFPDFHGF